MGIKEFADGARNVWKAISVFPDPEDLYGGRKEYFDSIRQRTEYRLGEQDRQLKVKFGKPDDNVRSNLIGKVRVFCLTYQEMIQKSRNGWMLVGKRTRKILSLKRWQ